MKIVQIRSFSWSAFSCIRPEYGKRRTRKRTVFGHFSRSGHGPKCTSEYIHSHVIKEKLHVTPLIVNPTKWSNTLKQFFDKLPTNCLIVFDHFMKLVLTGLNGVFYQTWFKILMDILEMEVACQCFSWYWFFFIIIFLNISLFLYYDRYTLSVKILLVLIFVTTNILSNLLINISGYT